MLLRNELFYFVGIWEERRKPLIKRNHDNKCGRRHFFYLIDYCSISETVITYRTCSIL